MRWKGILRGMGAPGFIAYWVGTAVFLHLLPHAAQVEVLIPLDLAVQEGLTGRLR